MVSASLRRRQTLEDPVLGNEEETLESIQLLSKSSEENLPNVPRRSWSEILLEVAKNKKHWQVCILATLLALVAFTTLSSSLSIIFYSNDLPQEHKLCDESASQFSLALHQSYGLFDDISNKTWKLMQRRVKEHQNHANPGDPMQLSGQPAAWYQENYEPDFSCPSERRVGKLGDGGKWVCNPHRIQEVAAQHKNATGEQCIIYSVGSNGEFSFELAIGNFFGNSCEIHIFDPLDYSSQVPEAIQDIVHFHPWGLKSVEEMAGAESLHVENVGSFHSLPNTFEALGHINHTIDIFKIDCEGCEWQLYKDWLNTTTDIRQILLEVHNAPQEAIGLFDGMKQAGYVTFHKEPNIQWAGGNCVEYCFLKLDHDFFV